MSTTEQTRGAHETEVVIRPAAATFRFDLRELYRYRHLFAALVWRNVRVQFDAMHFGFVWAFTRPVLYLVVFTVFRNLSGANTHVEIPYPLYVYSGLILWYYFLDATMASAKSISGDAALLTKVYYPRIMTPVVPIVASMVNLAISLLPMAILMVWYGVYPSWHILLLPVVILQCVALIVGVGTLFASLSLESRDWERLLQFALYLGLFVSPVIYAPDMIPEHARDIYLLNPIAGTLLAFRSAFFGPYEFPVMQWAYSLAFSLLVLAVGLWNFQRREVEFADKL
jgi:lipopolysaccharide transport system permease protein